MLENDIRNNDKIIILNVNEWDLTLMFIKRTNKNNKYSQKILYNRILSKY